MIQLLASKYQKHIAYSFLLLFYLATAIPLYAMRKRSERKPVNLFVRDSNKKAGAFDKQKQPASDKTITTGRLHEENIDKIEKADIGGPAQPEMSKFRSASADNLVNLFTGDFSYNIPLLDVGGYPVNIFYDGGISPEQEASWVGLGWNINPGTISRNMRGVPDDFDGTDKLKTTQSMKPNVTWGGRFGADFEVVGIKKLPFGLNSLGGSLGVSVNNYLGPALELGIKGGVSFKVATLSGAEKNAHDPTLNIGAGLNANLNSRGGLTISPSASLTVHKELDDWKSISGGIGASTSYNSRTGLQNLNLNGQFSYNRNEEETKCINNEKVVTKYQNSSISPHLLSTSISFAKPSYNPSIRMPITNEAYAGHFQLGGALWGLYTSGEIEVYKQTSSVAGADMEQTKPMVGYLYYQKANGNADAVVDFSRFNDKEVTPHTPIISAPQYSYDVFSINGEGTGGSIRLYRNDYGYVRDNYTKSQDKSLSIGGDVGIPGHYGANVNVIKTPSTIGEWNENNKLRTSIPFSEAKGINENVYFRNPGETSVLSDDQFNKIGGTDLVRFKLGGSSMNPSIEPVLERFSNDYTNLGVVTLPPLPTTTSRKKRTQVVSYLTAAEAGDVGLDEIIKIYDAAAPLFTGNNLAYQPLSRVEGYRAAHHISQINVTEANGSRYIYDVPVYNIVQRDYTFTVGTNSPDDDIVAIDPNEADKNSSWLLGSSNKDGYLQVNETPAYAHSFLLGGLLTPDYVDVNGDGITEDDAGNAVKFNYTRIKDANGNWAVQKWRTPHGSQSNRANLNAGTRTNVKDDKGIITYGERESWYLHSIESKTMIALFTLEDRRDGKGAANAFGGLEQGVNANALKRLKKIDLYSKADLKKNGLTGNDRAKPVKTVFFEYSYKLCGNSSDNSTEPEYRTINGNQVDVNANKGKLTLDRIYFTFNGQDRANKNQYKFVYENSNGTGNPGYDINTSDRWGGYKPKSLNPSGLKNADYPYSIQPKDAAEKDIINLNAAAWGLKKILLPSGGQIEVEYESDDYAFVQDRRAATMMSVAGFGKNNSSFSNELYSFQLIDVKEHNYVLINVPEACTLHEEVYYKYLQGQEQLAFKLAVQMPEGVEYMSSYGVIDYNEDHSFYGIYGAPENKQIWVRLKNVNGLSPLSVTALEFLKEQLPGQAFEGHDVSEGTTLEQFAGMVEGLVTGLRDAFRDPITSMRSDNKARYTNLAKCFVRLNDPDGYKYGGGHRVKKVVLKDNWDKMSNQHLSTYGTEYGYTTTEDFNGQPRPISSGVASYEPSIGGEENPFQTMVQIIDRLPLGPSSYGAVEMPVLDAFFPAPIVGYSKVTVRSLKKGNIPEGMKSRSGVGRQVTEFYTAKDFPVYYKYTPLEDKNIHKNNFGAFFWKWAFDSRAISQGFLVATNDMHGKLKSQSSYAENDPTLRVSYTENFYRNTGAKGMDEKFDFVYGPSAPENGLLAGDIRPGNMGIDVELMTDTREFSVKSVSQEVQGQVDDFGIIWLPFIWKVKTKSDNIYRAVTCTKVINYHSVVDKVLVIDKGSKVSTENLVYDAETGDVIVNRTNNEFDKPVFTVNYPAYWAYSGMGLAYKNIDAVFENINFSDGEIVSGIDAPDVKKIFESGDELYIMYAGTSTVCDPAMISSGEKQLIWAFNKNKNTSSLTDINPDFIFIDKEGKPYSRAGVKFRIVRSGKRNMLSASVAGISMMTDPVIVEGSNRKLVANSNFADNTKKIVNASAVEYKEKWQNDNDVFYRYRLEYPNSSGNLVVNGDFSQGNTGFTTQYTYHPSSYTSTNPYYSIATTSNGWHPTTANCSDHTSGNGNMMLVDGAVDYERVVWSQIVPVTPNTAYLLSAWAMDIQQSSPGHHPTQLRFKINGTQVGEIFGLGAVNPCIWRKFFNSWNSGISTSAVIEISSKDLVENGNDFALDDISFETEQCALAQIEVTDCSGFLEKRINPYPKGLLGNYKAYLSRVFYGERMENNPVQSTNLPENGYLKDFGLYWNFNGSNSMTPDASQAAKWARQVESTLYNAKGLELETKYNTKGLELETEDALDIYTSAQYGYRKTMPIAIANNSRYKEMMYEGFEDYDYAETLAGATYNICTKKHIDFTGVENSQIIPFDNAHSGKYVLSVPQGQVASKTIAVNAPASESFTMQYQTNTTGQLNDPGGNYSIITESTNTTFTRYNAFSNFGANVQTAFRTPSDGGYVNYTYKTTQYFEIHAAGTYSLFVSSNRVSDFSAGFSPGTLNWNLTSVATGTAVPYTIVWSYVDYQYLQSRAQICLPKGVYLLECTYSGAQNGSCPTCLTSDNYNIYIENNVNNITTYKSLSSQSSCTYTIPLSATEEMINPTFSIPADKKMVFSAWVRESNTQVSTYNNNEVQIDFGSGTPIPMQRSGPIIEGWQRYEGYFTAPIGVTSMNLKLVNSSDGTIYFDDIRIHPFNANMKSYVYDPVNLRLTAQLDPNNYATFYEYNEEGDLIRTKAETKEGVKTLNETRSAKQKLITEVQ